MVDFAEMSAAAKRYNRSDAPLELNIGDQWRARWVEGEPLPAAIPVAHLYATLVMDDKGYVVRARGTEAWNTIEGAPEQGEKPDAALKRLAKAQANAAPGRVGLIGYLDCRATSHNTEYAKDARTIRPVYLFVAKQMKDLGRESAYERRRMPMNEYMMAIRNRYPEIDDYLPRTVERYYVMRAKGEI